MAAKPSRLQLLIPVFLVWCVAADSSAQSYPAKVVRYLIPTPAGSGADVIGRIVAGGMTQSFGQQVVVDNRGGAANNIGAEVAAKAPPDGYTLFQASLTHAVNATLYRNLAYDLVRDFAPVTQLASSPYVLVVHPSLPVKTTAELVRLAKARPGAINYSSGGTGSSTFLARSGNFDGEQSGREQAPEGPGLRSDRRPARRIRRAYQVRDRQAGQGDTAHWREA